MALLPVADAAGEGLSSKKYSNPVFNTSMADPTVVKGDDGYFYVYGTGRNVRIGRSANLVDWEYVGTAFTEETRPSFESKASIWAPDIHKIGDKFVMYYSMSVWGGEWTCGIGCAVADRPEGPFEDKGKMFKSFEIGVKNSIDPCYFEEDGKKYLIWGSFRGIFRIELDESGYAVKKGVEPVRVAGTAYEGTYIHKRDGMYYMFASIGTCCEGAKSTYTTVVGRSDNFFGPYLDKSGRRMLDNCHEILIRKSDRFVGTGHNSGIVTDSEGSDWLLYHAFDLNEPSKRVLMLDRIVWRDGWPEVQGSQPSSQAQAPVFE